MNIENIQPFIPVALVIALVIAGGIESIHPFFEKSASWQNKITNILIMVFFFMVSGIMGVFSSELILQAEQKGFGLLQVVSVPFYAEIILGFFLCDLVNWITHILKHKIPFLWKFHRVHHSDEHMNATTALRNHPLEAVINAVFTTAGYVLLGISPLSIVFYTLILLPMLVVTHANLQLPASLDKWLNWIIVTPAYHKIHHSDQVQEADSNYADLFSIWDRIFGTLQKRKNLREIRFGFPGLQDTGILVTFLKCL